MDKTFLLLSRLSSLACLSEQDLLFLAKNGEIFSLKTGDYLLHQNDNTDHLFIIIQGKMIALEISPVFNEERIIAHIKTGEIVGELGVLSDKKRALSIRSHSNANVFKINKSLAKQLFNSSLTFHKLISNSIIDRFQSVLNTQDTSQKKIISLLCANDTINDDELIKRLTLFNNHIKLITEQDVFKSIKNPCYHDMML
ncbi:cyclic nucleotide-binding domain-containing protein [Thiotrichales bacterium 19S3-7]|nr:cyclic nucleotide-binding domain-containing protein [Thiotrichales bacterium 19S3-7]MCF6800562.1 cyclic nucleotide-binding domain-containing protein [Thiotrichales bacterium 19S3-11]